jgi:CelD/BcsL family acetyltransferase involved in cellulose biosynthesis
MGVRRIARKDYEELLEEHARRRNLAGRQTSCVQFHKQEMPIMNAMASTPHPASFVSGSEGVAAHTKLRIKILNDLAVAKPDWLDLERNDGLSTPYQHFAWVSCWYEHLGKAAGVTPYIVVGEDETGRPLFLLPLGRERIGPLTVARFVGGKHSNSNLGLWRRDYASAMTRADLDRIVGLIGSTDPSVDLLALLNQPVVWDEVPNPLALLPRQDSPSFSYRGRLARDFDELVKERVSSSTRKKLRQKERALSKHGSVRYWRAETSRDVRRVLDAFFVQKAERMKELGLANVFAEAGVRQFVEAAATQLGASTATSSIEFYAASVGDVIVATFAGIGSNRRFCGMFNSMISGEFAHQSPGELLLANVVRMCCERGYTTFDLGIGEAAYKKAAPFWRTHLNLKRGIKHSSRARHVVEAVRRRLTGG